MPPPQNKKTAAPAGWEPVEDNATPAGWEPVDEAPALPPGTLKASPKPGTADWFKEKGYGAVRGALDLLPTAGGIAGGLVGGGAGLETGPGALVTGAIGAAAGGGLGEDVKQVGEKAIFHEGPKTGTEAAKRIALQAGLQGANELTGRAAGKVIGPAVKYFGDTASASSKAGVKLLPSEAAGKAPSYLEKFVKGSVLTSGKMDKFRELQNAQTKAAVDKVADSLSSFRGSPEQLGELVQKGLDQHTKEFRAIQKKMYDDIGAAVNERIQKVRVQVASKILGPDGKPVMTTVLQDQVIDDVMPSTVQLKQFAKDELGKLKEVEKVLDPNLLSQSRSMLENLLKAPNRITYKAMAAARSDTLSKVRELDQALAGKQAGLAKKMADLFDESMIDGAQKSGIPGLVDDIRKANAFTANEHKMFEQALVKKIVDTKKPETIATLIRGKAIGNDETRDLFKILPPSLKLPVQRQIIIDTMRQSTNNISKAFNERKFAETIGGIGDERGKIIFGNNWKNIKELTSIMERINGPVGIGGGSGASLANLGAIKAMYTSMLAVIPGAEMARGEYMGAAKSLAFEYGVMNALAYGMTHPETAEKMLKAAQQVLKFMPYGVTGAVAVDRGQRRAKGEPVKGVKDTATDLLNKAKTLQDGFHRSGLAPEPTPTTPSVPTPPTAPNVTHYFDPDTGQVLPVN